MGNILREDYRQTDRQKGESPGKRHGQRWSRLPSPSLRQSRRRPALSSLPPPARPLAGPKRAEEESRAPCTGRPGSARHHRCGGEREREGRQAPGDRAWGTSARPHARTHARTQATGTFLEEIENKTVEETLPLILCLWGNAFYVTFLFAVSTASPPAPVL